MLYLLWSVYIGIACGCQLFEVGVLTSIVVALALLVLERINFGRRPFVLILHSLSDIEPAIQQLFASINIRYKIKSRNFTSRGYDYAIEFTAKSMNILESELAKNGKIEKYSIIEYDADDIV